MFGISRIKLQWATSRTTPGRWFLGLVGLYQRRNARGYGVALSIRGVLLWALASAVVGYFAGGAYYWWKLERRSYNFVRYVDVLLYPLSKEKRAEVRELQGKAMIAAGLDDLKAQQWNRGLMNLRLGLERHPSDLNARLKVAQLFLAYRVRQKAQETLMRGLDYGWPGRSYLQSAVDMAVAGEDSDLVIEICDRALALHVPGTHSPADRRWLVERRVRALLAEKRAEEALAYAEREADMIDEATLFELRVVSLLQAGRAAEAVTLAESRRNRVAGDPQTLRLLARSYREAGRGDDMKKVLDMIRAEAPADPRTHVFAFVQQLMADRVEEARALIDDYIFRFGGTDANYVLAAQPLAEIGRGAELEILISAAAERGIRDPRLLAARLEVLVAERRWAEASRQITDLRTLLPPEAASRAGLLDLFQYLVAAASDPADGAQSGLTDYIRSRQLPMSAYRRCIEVLRQAGRLDTARRVVTFAEGVYPSSQYLAESRASLDADIAARDAVIAAARPVPVQVAGLASAASFRTEIERVVAEGGPVAGLALFRELRKARPDWAATEEESLARREMELHAQGDDLAALQGAARRYLSADRERIGAVVTLATGLFEKKREAEARMLLNEILRRAPGDPLASGLLVRWFPPQPEAVEPASP